MPLGHERWNAHILIKFRSFQDSSIWCNPDILGSSKSSKVQKNFIARATLHQLSVAYLDVGVSQGKEAQQGSHTHTHTHTYTHRGGRWKFSLVLAAGTFWHFLGPGMGLHVEEKAAWDTSKEVPLRNSVPGVWHGCTPALYFAHYRMPLLHTASGWSQLDHSHNSDLLLYTVVGENILKNS